MSIRNNYLVKHSCIRNNRRWKRTRARRWSSLIMKFRSASVVSAIDVLIYNLFQKTITISMQFLLNNFFLFTLSFNPMLIDVLGFDRFCYLRLWVSASLDLNSTFWLCSSLNLKPFGSVIFWRKCN